MALHTYNKTTWATGDPITQNRMQNIEDGIENAYSDISSVNSGILSASTAISTLQGKMSDAENDIVALRQSASDSITNGMKGLAAWNAIYPMIQIASGTVEQGNIVYSQTLQQYIDQNNTIIVAMQGEINGAHRVTGDSLKLRFEKNESDISTLGGYIGAIQTTLGEASVDIDNYPYDSFNLRINADEQKIKDVQTILNNARSSSVFNSGTPYGSLDARLEDDEGKINTNITNIGNLQINKINYTDVIIDLQTNSNMPLAASQGRELKQIIGGSYTTSNTVATGISNAEQNAKDYADGKLGSSFDTTNTVAKAISDLADADTTINGRLDDIDTTIGATATDGLKGRIKALEDEVDAANGEGTLDDRFDAIESDIGDIETALANINNGSNTTISGMNDKIDAIAGELGMYSESDTTASTRIDTLESSFTSLQNTVNDASTGLAATKAIADAAATASDLTALSGRVTTLEGKDTIIVDYDGEHSNYTNDEPNLASPSENADYLIADDEGKYFYWRYFGAVTGWQLVGGAGGSGNGSSSGVILSALPAVSAGDSNIDYFIGTDALGYIHYRFIEPVGNESEGHYIEILPKGLIADISVNGNGGLVAHTREDSNTNLLSSFNALKTVDCVATYDTDGITPKSYALSFTDTSGHEYAWDLSAGGGGSSYTVQFINETSNLELYVPNDATAAVLSARIYARLGSELLSQTGSITVKYKTESAAEYTTARIISNVANNVITNIDVIDLLAENSTMNIQLTASIQPEDTPITRNITYTIHRVPMYIEAYNYNPASVKTSNFNFQYYCVGSNLSKTVHFVIDGTDTTEDIGMPANTDLLTKQISVADLARGMHSLKVYFTVGSFSSNEINTYFLYNDGTQVNKPMIALSTNKATIQDGENLNLNYTVYTQGLEKTEEVTLETYTMIDNVRTVYETKSYENVDNSIEHTIAITNYPSSGTFYMTMSATHTVDGTDYVETKTTSVTITEYVSEYDSQMVRAGLANLIYEYDAAGRTNNDSDKAAYEYVFTAVSGDTQTFTGTSTNFNWASNGYTNGASLVISGGATHTVDVPLFVSNTGEVSLETDTNNDDILKNGRTFEIDYEVNTATDLNAEIASFGNGLRITPSVSYLVPQNTTVTVNSHGLIEKEDEICAAYLATGKRMHMVFVIEPKSTTPTSQGEYHQCVNIYINGEFVNSCPYALSDNFSTMSTFTIGSNTCIINLYSIRMYNRGLTNDEVLRNYMMAPTTKVDKINRFAANDVLNNNKLVDYSKAINKFNCLLITGEISPYKKSTKTPSGLTLTKPDFENLTYTTEFNLLDKNGSGVYYSSNNVQGTSSQTYPIHNLKIYLAREESTTTTDPESGDEVVTTSAKKVQYSLKGANGIGESTLCWKADYMSTDHANTYNANFANDLFTDKLPSQLVDPKVQNTVYGIRCLLFQRDDENSTPVFIADGCLNNDKGNNNAFGLSIQNESGNDTTRQKWEFTNNSSALDFFQADGLLANSNGDYYAKTAFESTFPDEGDLEDEGLEPNYNHLQVLMTWVHQRANYWDASDVVTGTTYTYNGTTYDNLKAYKKAIFKNEFTRHFNLNHVLTYHLFSEFIALCDNRAKNMFVRCDNVRDEEVFDMSGNTIFSGNNNVNASFFTNTTNIGTQDDPIYALTNADQINWEDSTFAVWYPVLYDLDSCYGAENVGRITIAYDADWNYSYNNKNQFSGVDSRLWLMVEDSFGAELKALAQTLYPNSLNYNTFYTTQVQAMLDSVCPAIVNQDMLLKFDAYWADGFIDYSLPNNPHVYRDYKYIQRGSRAYQKDTFIKLRSNYLSSKYVTSNFMNDQIRFRSSVIIPVSNSGITVTTNQTLYPAITYGDKKEAIRSVNKIGPGESVTLQASDQVGNTDTIHIGGASALTDIGDISKFEPYNLDVSGGINLKSLIVGSNVVNGSTNKIDGLGSCALLETLNVRNCVNFSGTLNLSGNGLIKNVYAAGSGITNIELREGGNLTNIEYGALTSTIKIVNHGGLQSFTYEDSANNNYANVTRLHIENTPNVPVVDIINHAMSHLTAGVRLVGININLGDDPTFLQTITSDLAKGKYINSEGIFVPSSTSYPYISGTVTIASIRSSLLNTLNQLYPNLTINVARVDQEFEVTYKNYDGTTLYIDHGISTDPVIDPVYDTNPITNASYISMPTKPEDVQYRYRFGTYDNQNRYRRFSGWVRQGTNTNPTSDSRITGTLTYVAVFPTTETQRYTVKWFGETTDTEPLLSYTEDYGTPIGTFAQPEETETFIRAKQVGNGVKIFKGWSRPVGKLTGNINVYAQWETSTINDDTYHIALNQFSAADVYALATQVSSSRKDTLIRGDDHIGEPIMIRMGQEFDYIEGATITNLVPNGEKLVFEGYTDEAMIYNDIRPLSINQDWTLALDYQFLLQNATALDSGQEFVLASCYQNANSSVQGFKISLLHGSNESADKVLQVTWGTQSQVIDYISIDNNYTNEDGRMYCKSFRNMIVLAHNADSKNDLVIYYAPPLMTNQNCPIGGADYGNGVISTTLTWTTNDIDIPLILGGNYDGNTTNIESNQSYRRPAQGIIYWGKYWDVDLGGKACAELAAWPHETVPFHLSGYNGASGAIETIYEGAELSFVAAQGIGSRYCYSTRNGAIDDETNYAGWHASRMRTICNNLIYQGMPTAYKSIIRLTPVVSNTRYIVQNSTLMSNITTYDYLFLPSQCEVDSGNISGDSSSYITREVYYAWTRPWHWMIAGNLDNVYGAGNIAGVLVKKTVTNLQFYRYRFSGNYIKPTARIYNIETNPASRSWTYNSATIQVQSGDIWINPSDNIAYMYFTNEEIAQGAIVDQLATNGGWKRADIWNLRTYHIDQAAGGENFFKKIGYMGEYIFTPGASTQIGEGRLLCPEFTV